MEANGTPKRAAYADDLYCPECGYSLRGLTSDRCPECGLRLDFIESDTPLIPWERRRALGRLRAYWQTVWQVMFRTRIFCRAIYRRVSYRDAQLFRWITILHVYIPALLALAVVHVLYPNLLPLVADETGWWFVIVVGGCVLLALAALTGVPSYLFHPRSLPLAQQNRAVALSYYGCAALSLTPLALGIAGAGLAVSRTDSKLAALVTLGGLGVLVLAVIVAPLPRPFSWRTHIHPKLCLALIPLGVIALCVGAVAGDVPPRDVGAFLGAATPFALPALLLLYWFDLIALAKRTLRGALATLWVIVLVPVLWLIGCGLILVALPAVAYFLALVFYSLRGGSLPG
jgi:hypothetical protein